MEQIEWPIQTSIFPRIQQYIHDLSSALNRFDKFSNFMKMQLAGLYTTEKQMREAAYIRKMVELLNVL